MDFGKSSSPEITVAPVVVSPDIDSKNASLKDIINTSESKNGIVANSDNTNQKLTTTRIPSRILNSFLVFLNGSQSAKPLTNVAKNATTNSEECCCA